MSSLKEVLTRPARAVRGILKMPDRRAAQSAFWRSLKGHGGARAPFERHIEATYTWICAAQDSAGGGGVAGWYDLKSGWVPAYPETTGYIIPTFLAYADAAADDGARERALRMAEWEIEVQLPTGAVRGGLLGKGDDPAVFNTGQVIFGWTAAHRATGRTEFAQAAGRAAEWLLGIQDADGAWRTHLSRWTSSKLQSYNARAAWALAEAGLHFGQPRWVEAARKNCDWVLGQQDASGWFANNVFRTGEEPLLHTISYVIEGLFGVGLALGQDRYLQSATRAKDGLLARFEAMGRTHGRYATGWKPVVSWRCLTGDAQLAGILLRFHKYAGGDGRHRDAAEKIVTSLCDLQDMNPRRSGTYGGVPGSQPLWGKYLRYRFPNWAAKFHLDALLLLTRDVDPHRAA